MINVVLTLMIFTFAPVVSAEEPPDLPRVSSTVDAQLQQELLYLKEETVSIASRYEQPISEAPSNVYVITDEDIRQSGAIDIPTLLRRVPGMEVMQMTAADFNVSARGDNNTLARRLLVMVDGRSIYIDALGFVFWKAIPVTLPEIKRIEVLKGPASALYGFNAVDGIINIITKSPEELKGTTLQFGGGEFGTISSAAIHAGVQGKLGYRFSYGHDQTQQWNNRDSLAYRSNLFNTQLDYALSSKSRIQFSGGIVDVNKLDGPVLELVHDTTKPTLAYARAVYEHDEFLVSAYWNGSSDRADQQTTPACWQLQPLESPWRLQILEAESSGGLSARSRSRSLSIQRIERQTPGTSVGRHHRQSRDGLADGEILRSSSELRVLGSELEGDNMTIQNFRATQHSEFPSNSALSTQHSEPPLE